MKAMIQFDPDSESSKKFPNSGLVHSLAGGGDEDPVAAATLSFLTTIQPLLECPAACTGDPDYPRLVTLAVVDSHGKVVEIHVTETKVSQLEDPDPGPDHNLN